ncbi:MAG: hypothetical protein ACHQK8_08830, partial [Bacteroidia bacterium]
SLTFNFNTIGNYYGNYYSSYGSPFISAQKIDAMQIGFVLEKQKILGGEIDEKYYFYKINGFSLRIWNITSSYSLNTNDQYILADFNSHNLPLKFNGYEWCGIFGYGYQYNFNVKYGAYVDAKLNYGVGIAAESGAGELFSSFFYTLRAYVDIGIRARIK